MNQARTLKVSDRIQLRRPIITDLKKRFDYGSPFEFRVMSGGSKKPKTFTTEHAMNFYYRLMYSTFGWVIDYDKKMIGIARLNDVGRAGDLRYSVGIFDESLLGKGIGTLITKAVVDFAFNVVDVDSVSLMVLDINKRGIRCYEKSGFKSYLVLKDHHEVDGESFDDIIMVQKNPNKKDIL